MSEIKDLILSDDKLLKFFQDKPLMEMLQRGLTVNQINSEILQLDPDFKIEKKENDSLSHLEERQSLMVKIVMEMVESLKELCMFDSMSADDEHTVNDESFFINPEVRILVFSFTTIQTFFDIFPAFY